MALPSSQTCSREMRPSLKSQTWSMRKEILLSLPAIPRNSPGTVPVHWCFDRAEVIAVAGVGHVPLLGSDVGGEELVEALGGVWSVQWAVRCADGVVDHVVGVHGHRCVGVAGGLGGDVLIDQVRSWFMSDAVITVRRSVKPRVVTKAGGSVST